MARDDDNTCRNDDTPAFALRAIEKRFTYFAFALGQILAIQGDIDRRLAAIEGQMKGGATSEDLDRIKKELEENSKKLAEAQKPA